MDLNHYLVFEKVAEYQSFTKAALALDMEKSNVSMKVSQLEARLGVRLLNRTTRSVTLTEAGEGFYDYCRHIVETADEAESFIETLGAEPQGQLRISAPFDFGYIVLRTVIEPYLKAHPKVSIDLVFKNEPADMVRERIDVTLWPLIELEDSSLIARPLLTTRFGFYASKDYLKRRGTPASIAEIQKHDFILFSFPSGEANLISYIKLEAAYPLQSQPRIRMNDVLACREAAISGLGITLLPRRIARDAVERQQLVHILDDIELPEIKLYAFYPSRQWLPVKVRSFLEHLEKLE